MNDSNCKLCVWCNELLSKHDNIQNRICLQKLSDKIWILRKRSTNPEIKKLIDKYTKKTDEVLGTEGKNHE